MVARQKKKLSPHKRTSRPRSPHWRLKKDYIFAKPLSRLKWKYNTTYIDGHIPAVTSVIKPIKGEEVIFTSSNLTNLSNVKETDEISAAIIDIPSENQRVTVVDQIPAIVTHQRTTKDEIIFTIDVQNEQGKSERIPISINKNDGTVHTDDASVIIVAIEKEHTKTKIVTTEPIVTKKGKTKERVKSLTIMGLIMTLLCMWGKPTEVCQVKTIPMETTNAQLAVVTPQPHHFYLPDLNPLGVQGPLSFANMEILQRMENHMSDIIKASAYEKVQAAKSAYQFGTVVENIRNEQVISALKSDISNLKRDLSSSINTKNKMLHHATSLRSEVLDLSNNLTDIQRELIDLKKEYDTISDSEQQLKSSLMDAGIEKTRLVKKLNEMATEKNHIIDDFQRNIAELDKIIQEQTENLSDLTLREKETIEMNLQLSKTNQELLTNIAKLEQLNVVHQKEINELKNINSNLTWMIDDLSLEIQNGIKFHQSELRRLENEATIAEREAYTKGFTEADMTRQSERKNLMTQHDLAIKTLKDGESKLIHEAYVKGRRDMSDLIGDQVSTLQQKLNFARKNLDTFYQWAAPHIRVIRLPNGKYEVNYNAEHVSKVSPLLKDYIADLSEQFEKELNGAKNNPLTAHPTIDIKVTQKVIMNNGLVGKIKDLVLGPKVRETARYTMVLVGTSEKTDRDTPMQFYEYLPINVQDLAPYKELLEKAASISVTTVTTTLTSIKTETASPATVTETVDPITIVNEKLVTLPPQTKTLTEYHSSSTQLTATPSPFTETITHTATVTETPSVTTVTAVETSTSVVTPDPVTTTVNITKDAETSTTHIERTVTEHHTETKTKTEHHTETVVESSTVTPSPPSMALVIETPTSVSISTTTNTTTVVSQDPTIPNLTIHSVVSPDRAEVLENIGGENSVTKISAGETSDDGGNTTMVKTETGEKLSCFGAGGRFGVILKNTLFCVDDTMNRIDLLKTARRIGTPPPFQMTALEEEYYKGISTHPLVNDVDVVTKMQTEGKRSKHANWIKMHNWFHDNTDERSMSDMMKEEPEIFNRLTFFKMKELTDIHAMRKVRDHWMWGKQYEKSAQELEFYKHYGEQSRNDESMIDWFSDVPGESSLISGKIEYNAPSGAQRIPNYSYYTKFNVQPEKVPVHAYSTTGKQGKHA